MVSPYEEVAVAIIRPHIAKHYIRARAEVVKGQVLRVGNSGVNHHTHPAVGAVGENATGKVLWAYLNSHLLSGVA